MKTRLDVKQNWCSRNHTNWLDIDVNTIITEVHDIPSLSLLSEYSQCPSLVWTAEPSSYPKTTNGPENLSIQVITKSVMNNTLVTAVLSMYTVDGNSSGD